jgi:hypothetical protein
MCLFMYVCYTLGSGYDRFWHQCSVLSSCHGQWLPSWQGIRPVQAQNDCVDRISGQYQYFSSKKCRLTMIASEYLLCIYKQYTDMQWWTLVCIQSHQVGCPICLNQRWYGPQRVLRLRMHKSSCVQW